MGGYGKEVVACKALAIFTMAIAKNNRLVTFNSEVRPQATPEPTSFQFALLYAPKHSDLLAA